MPTRFDDIPTGYNRRKFGRTGLGMEQRYRKTNDGRWLIAQHNARGVCVAERWARPNEAFIIEQLYAARADAKRPGVTKGWRDPAVKLPSSTTGAAVKTLVSLEDGSVAALWYDPTFKHWILPDATGKTRLRVTAWQYLPRPHVFAPPLRRADQLTVGRARVRPRDTEASGDA